MKTPHASNRSTTDESLFQPSLFVCSLACISAVPVYLAAMWIGWIGIYLSLGGSLFGGPPLTSLDFSSLDPVYFTAGLCIITFSVLSLLLIVMALRAQQWRMLICPVIPAAAAVLYSMIGEVLRFVIEMYGWMIR